MKRFLISGALAALVILPATTFTAFTSGLAPDGQRINSARDGLALGGYDPVVYFVDGKPVPGKADLELTHNGARYRFATAGNRDRFAKEPDRFLPQYGGFCAYAVSRGYTANGDPLAWRIVEGHLYLNYSLSVQKTWEQDVPGNIRKADTNWPSIATSTK